ncbi:MAG TPA: NYN domain-containing protein [Chloroflexota bacterium]|nr:NYN domain-containing protein [Chloroflexota bacterium]
MRHIILDGYNVIRADPRLQSLERVSLEHARQVLVQTLASSPRLAGDQVTVVFDGAGGSRTHVHSHRLGRIDTVYSARGQSADDLIVSRAEALSRESAVVVVSNDVAVRERCRAAGCEVSGSENLLSQIPGRARLSHAGAQEGDDRPTLSTVKRGNPQRPSKRERRRREYRF